MTGETNASQSRVSSLQRVIEERVANPLFRSLLQSPLYWLVSNWLMLLSYTGHRSSQRFIFPVAYKRLAEEIVVVTPMEDSNWWRNFQDRQRCTIWLHGTERSAAGEVITGKERNAMLVEYFDTYGIVGRALGLGSTPEPPSDGLVQANQDLAVVRISLNEWTGY
ncbi:hypothetical protein [Haladaptatus sp. CMAA 1911]|uniref:hypothetical protein n=1 Tax=unclassified Haladaptatus TaxID=2622732 RepID=UPI0037550EC4